MKIRIQMVNRKAKFTGKQLLLITSILILSVVLTGCGPLGPDPIPSEYAGKSLKQLHFLPNTVQPGYFSLMRDPNKYDEKLIYLRGEISQVLSIEEDAYQVTMAITESMDGYWSDNVFLLYSLDRGPRLLKDDVVEVIGIFTGIMETESVFGSPIQMPQISVITAIDRQHPDATTY